MGCWRRPRFRRSGRRGQGHHRGVAAILQHRATAFIARLQAASTGGHYLACSATWISSIIGTGDGPKANHASRLKPDHLMGSGQERPVAEDERDARLEYEDVDSLLVQGQRARTPF